MTPGRPSAGGHAPRPQHTAALSALRLCALACVVVSCAGPLHSLTTERSLTFHRSQLVLRARPGADQDLDRTAAALEIALPRLEIWGGLRAPVTVHLLPDHASLERAVRRPGFDWLRAWARYDDVLLQAPSTWATAQAPLAELLAHELTHCLMFQQSADADGWVARRIPLWFREGMAIWTAKQGHRYPTLEDTSRWVQLHPELDPFADGEALSRDFSEPLYGLSHHAFGFLVQRYGERTVRALLVTMKGGAPFPEAFRAVIGVEATSFQREFVTYLRFKGFRDWARPVGRRPRTLFDVIPAAP
jgi:hypothetical protein